MPNKNGYGFQQFNPDAVFKAVSPTVERDDMTLVTAPTPKWVTPRGGRPARPVMSALAAVVTLMFGLSALALSAPRVGAAPQASVIVSKTSVPEGGETVTVTGTGFDPSGHTGTRPPFAGQPSGVYVVFGAFRSAVGTF